MQKALFKFSVCAIAVGLISVVLVPFTFAQSQALNGQIEGTVLDQNKAAVSDAVITVTNIEAGVTRTLKAMQAAYIVFHFYHSELIASPPKRQTSRKSYATG
jgi:hypothetical protein